MSSIDSRFMLYNINQISVSFEDDIGNSKKIRATGFWVEKKGIDYFFTNAHNIDPRMKLGNNTTFRLKSLSIWLRKKISGVWMESVIPCEVAEPDFHQKHINGDIIAFRNVSFLNKPEDCFHSSFSYDQLADKEFLENALYVTDTASFIGFPGSQKTQWYDEAWNFPIARTVNIASLPGRHFSNSHIATGDVMLVSGLSFSGSSGSPVISHAIVEGFYYRPMKLIGIMSGHWWNEEADDAFKHSGLSYLTRSTAVLDLLI